MLSKLWIDDFLRRLDVLKKEAKQILPKAIEIHNKFGFNRENEVYLENITTIDENDITFEGDETWNYGGYEHHRFNLDIRYLYDETFIQDMEKKAEIAAEELIEENKKKEQQREVLLEYYDGEKRCLIKGAKQDLEKLANEMDVNKKPKII